MSVRSRPLSPHLGIYRPQLTSILSILHRITGVGLFVGMGGFWIWIWALSQGPEVYKETMILALSPIGQGILWYGFSCLCFHSLNGIRHLMWDLGFGLSLPMVHQSGWAVVGGTGLLLLGGIFLW